MATNLDVRFEEALAKDTQPARASSSIPPARWRTRTRSRTGSPRCARPPASPRASAAARRPPHVRPGGLLAPDLGPAPEFTGTEQWFNTPGGRPLTLAGLRGHVVLVDFWTYTCINCIRTLPFLKGLYATYHRYGLEIVGVETPEFTFEQDAGNVAQAIRADGLRYPVVQDNNYGTWNAYSNEYWPAEYLIDAQGQVRHTQFGEGDYRQSEAAVRALLLAAGARTLPPPMTAHAIMPSTQLATPETYLDPQRAQGFITPPQAGSHYYPGAAQLGTNEFALKGPWRINSEAATASPPGASIEAGCRRPTSTWS